MARKITSDSRVRMEIKLTGYFTESITMTAGAWNMFSVGMFAAAEKMEKFGCTATAKEYKEIADRITAILTIKGFYR